MSHADYGLDLILDCGASLDEPDPCCPFCDSTDVIADDDSIDDYGNVLRGKCLSCGRDPIPWEETPEWMDACLDALANEEAGR